MSEAKERALVELEKSIMQDVKLLLNNETPRSINREFNRITLPDAVSYDTPNKVDRMDILKVSRELNKSKAEVMKSDGTDMGLSKVKYMNTVTTTVAGKRDTQPGTPAYQAPEIILNSRRARTQSDIWSLCCTLVEPLAGKTIWDLIDSGSRKDEEDNSVQVIISSMQRKEMPHELCHLDMENTLSSDLKSIIQKDLTYEMDKRPTALNSVVLLKIFLKTCNKSGDEQMSWVF